MASQLIVRDRIIELAEDITYNFQVSDVGNVSLSKSNYTSTFKIPKTHENVALFDALGVPSDTSSVPYVINNVSCLQDHNLVYSGTLVFLKTDSKYYNVTVISGAFDLFTKLSDTSFGDLPLTDLRIIKTISEVADEITYADPTKPYTFFLGKFSENPYHEGGINIDPMPIAVRIPYLLQQIQAYSGVTFEFPQNIVDAMGEEFFTFPYPDYISVGGTGTTVFNARRDTDTTVGLTFNEELNDKRSQYAQWETSNVPTYEFTHSNFDITSQISGERIISFPKMSVESFGPGEAESSPPTVVLKVNGVEIGRFPTQTREEANESEEAYRTIYNFQVGDVLRIEFHQKNTQTFLRVVGFYELVVLITRPEISEEGMKTIFSFKMSDFVKEIMYRYALVPFSRDNNVVEFVPISQLYSLQNESEDWSEKFQRRTEEVYDIGYAQNNYLRHSYDKEGDEYFDKNLKADNLNLPLDKTILTTKSYAASKDLLRMYTQIEPRLSPAVLVREFLSAEISDDMTVKTLNRNYFVKIVSEYAQGRVTRLTSGILPQDLVILDNYINVGYFEEQQFAQNNYWNDLIKIIHRTRMHTIELALNFDDIRKLDLTKKYYFSQESAYYILSTLQYKPGELSKAQFVKIQ